MSLERKAIRRFMSDALRGNTIAGTNVRNQPSEPIRTDLVSGPVLSVYTMDEDADVHADTPREYLARVELAVELFVPEVPGSTSKTAEDLADDLAAQVFSIVEACIPQMDGIPIQGCPPLAVNPSRSGYDRTEVEFDHRGRQIHGHSRMVFVVAYGRPVDERLQARVEKLETVGISWDFPPPDGLLEAGDEIEVPQE